MLLSETTLELLGISVPLVRIAEDEDDEPVIGLFSVVEAVFSLLGAVDGKSEDSKDDSTLLVGTGAVVGTVSI